MESARLQREQTKSDPGDRDSRNPRPHGPVISRRPLTLNDIHSPAFLLGQNHSATQILQARLTIGQPGDQYERKADRVADQVMRMADPATRLQRKCSCGGSSTSGEMCAGCAPGPPVEAQRQAVTADDPSKAAAHSSIPDLQRSSGLQLDQSTRALFASRRGDDFSHARPHPNLLAAGEVHVNGVGEESMGDAGTPMTVPTPPPRPPPPTPTPPGQSPRPATPCPTTVAVGAVAQRNHSDLSATEKERWATWLGAMSRMDVGPGPDHTGHCMKERLTTVSNTCPEAVYRRAGERTEPCSGDRCLDINRYGSMWGLTDGPTAFFDMHRTRAPNSLLEGTGVSSCSVVCEQTYTCDRTQPTTGTFTITRNYQAGTHTRADGTTMHITTGTVTKT